MTFWWWVITALVISLVVAIQYARSEDPFDCIEKEECLYFDQLEPASSNPKVIRT